MSNKLELEKKLEKIQHGWADTVHGLPVKELEENLLIYAKHREEVQNGLRDSKEINSAKEALAELKGPYSDALKAINAKSSYIALLIKEKTDGPATDEEQDSAEEE